MSNDDLKYALFLGCVIPNRYPFIECATRAVFEKFKIELVDMKGASCCPAPGVFRGFDIETWLVVGARNISIAEELGLDIALMCNGCYGSLLEVNHTLKHDKEKKRKVYAHLAKIGREYKGTVQIGEDRKFAISVALSGIEIIDDIVGLSLFLLRDDPNFKFSSKSVCSHSDRDITDKLPVQLKRDYEGLSTMDTCFLEQGYICIGPVTQAGCGTICPNKANAPCLGCYGATIGVKDPGVQFISTLGSLCKDKDPEEVLDFIKDPAGLFNRFTLAASTLGHKYHDKMDDE